MHSGGETNSHSSHGTTEEAGGRHKEQESPASYRKSISNPKGRRPPHRPLAPEDGRRRAATAGVDSPQGLFLEIRRRGEDSGYASFSKDRCAHGGILALSPGMTPEEEETT